MSKLKVLITGAYGFLGRYTAKLFSAQGHDVTGMGHGKWYQDEFSIWGINTWVETTITFEALININQTFDIIVHCGGSGSVGYSTVHPYEDFQKTVQSTLAVLEYIRLKCPQCKFIYPSSVSVQGSQPDQPIKEDVIGTPISPYGFHKKIAEELCISYHQNFSITVGIIRFFSIYGVGLKKQLLYDACKKMSSANDKEVVFWGTGDETRDWIYIEDAASLIYNFALEVEGKDIINGGTGAKVKISDVLNKLRSKLALDIKISFNNESREGDPKYFWSDITKANKYNWQPITALNDGLDLYVEYFKSLKG